MNSESTAPADHLQRSAAPQNGLWSPPPTAALVAREARAVDWTARVECCWAWGYRVVSGRWGWQDR
eukprot:4510035-Prymnesium_polylepis.1